MVNFKGTCPFRIEWIKDSGNILYTDSDLHKHLKKTDANIVNYFPSTFLNGKPEII